MSDEEHAVHSKHVGAWLAVMVIGVIVFEVPMLFFDNAMALIVFMFSLGGMLWVLYFSVYAIFRHTYHEIAIAAVMLWIAFLVSFVGVSNLAPGASIRAYALFVSTVVVITVMGITGMFMLFNASREFVKEFSESHQSERRVSHRAATASRRAARRRKRR
jgi:amino acid transporter